jgi:hypothetical protein
MRFAHRLGSTTRRRFWAFSLLGSCLFSACSSESIACTSDLQPSVTVQVVDGRSGEVICDASVRIDDGQGQIETSDWSCDAALAWEIGAYVIEVAHPDYQASAVQVESRQTECGPERKSVVVRLEPN